jgi:hypothetical protein
MNIFKNYIENYGSEPTDERFGNLITPIVIISLVVICISSMN